MSKLKVNEIEKHDGSQVTISSPITIAANQNITVAAGSTAIDLSAAAGTISLPANSVSGNAIDGGTISDFASSGIDDNADTNVITLDSSENMTLTANSNLTLSGTGTVTTVDLTASGTTSLGPTTSINSVRVQALVPRAWWRGSMTITYAADGVPAISSPATLTSSIYGTALPTVSTVGASPDTLTFTYSADTGVLDGTKSCASINFYNDSDLVAQPSYSAAYNDASLVLTFNDGTAAGLDSKTCTVHMTVIVMALP
jgi:hypothetical protein